MQHSQTGFVKQLRTQITTLFDAQDTPPDVDSLLADFLEALNQGTIRAAEPDDQGNWHTLPLHSFSLQDRVRIVPGGSAIRSGAYVAPGVICMPPMYINIGAYVDEETMVDSHVLVGTCAQIGKRVHLSAGVQIGGVLEPPSAQPVIIEDDVFIGALSGIFEGVRVRRRAVIASGVAGSRPIHSPFAREHQLAVYTPVIVKYRDAKTDAKTILEHTLR